MVVDADCQEAVGLLSYENASFRTLAARAAKLIIRRPPGQSSSLSARVPAKLR